MRKGHIAVADEPSTFVLKKTHSILSRLVHSRAMITHSKLRQGMAWRDPQNLVQSLRLPIAWFWDQTHRMNNTLILQSMYRSSNTVPAEEDPRLYENGPRLRQVDGNNFAGDGSGERNVRRSVALVRPFYYSIVPQSHPLQGGAGRKVRPLSMDAGVMTPSTTIKERDLSCVLTSRLVYVCNGCGGDTFDCYKRERGLYTSHEISFQAGCTRAARQQLYALDPRRTAACSTRKKGRFALLLKPLSFTYYSQRWAGSEVPGSTQSQAMITHQDES